MRSSRFSEIKVRPDESIDEFLDGRLRLIQSRNGYRFSIDAVLLSEFVSTKAGDVVMDLGTGCGVIPLILLLTRPIGHVLGIEIQPDLACQASRNAALNGFAHRMGVILGDIKGLPLKSLSADVVLCNPPYRGRHSGRINPDPRRAIARHEIRVSLDDILAAAGRLLRMKGRLAMVYPAARVVDILVRMRNFNLEPKRMRVVYPGERSDSKMVLVEASLGGKAGLKILPPLFDQGDFSI
jgi:tRNA1Val (adenine37-N6)-methyltransferase